MPFRQFVLKVHSRCNLACTYCYLYQGPDASWRDRPARVQPRTMRQVARRMAEHAAIHRLDRMRVDLHGGEPLLGGPDTVIAYARTVRDAIPAHCTPAFTVQTNGTLLTEHALDRLAVHGIGVGLSLDGGTAQLNARRVDHAGRPSWPAAERAARLLTRRGGQYAGVLCTIDVTAPPADVYESLLELAPSRVDFLLPHANWATPPPGVQPSAPGRRPRPTPYGDWLSEAFDLWWGDPRGTTTRVRLFQEALALLVGAPSASEALGLSPMAAVVVETDGTIEQVDSLRSAYPGASATGLDVHRHSFDAALRHPGIAARALGAAALATECRACPVVRVCGGGNYAHRYAPRDGFRNPSVYCADLERLVRHIAQRLCDVTDKQQCNTTVGP
ncbi:FxsB family radical SAM/SPASM domain protein [Streptomyces sp. MUM 203J]|nr:FxsB family radical SAM/SPASM domain protein [Streptomyces sp. MUM 203J]